MTPVYEDNHIIIINKDPGEIVQGDKTGDTPLCDIVAQYLKEKYAKPGNVFCGVAHRLDRPVGGLVVFAKTSKALTRLNEMFRTGQIHKTYWAISRNRPPQESGELVHYITTTERNNKSYASVRPSANAKEARLRYKLLASTERYHLIEVELLTPETSDQSAAFRHRLSDKRGPEIRRQTFKPRRINLAHCPSRRVRASCQPQTDIGNSSGT